MGSGLIATKCYQVPSWQLQRAPMASPRPAVQGCGMDGMMQNFPPPPPSLVKTHPHRQDLPHNLHRFLLSPEHLVEGANYFRENPKHPDWANWKADEEFYDNQKVNGLPLPRVIRSSRWSQLKDIEGCDPLTVPFSKLLYQGSENFWLRKLATGREVYVATMGEVSQVVFASEILAQIRGRGIDLDRLGQRKSLQDGINIGQERCYPTSNQAPC